MTHSRQTDLTIAEQAAEWLSLVEDGGAAEREAFAAWLKESPRHVGEVLIISAMSEEFAGLDLRHLLNEAGRESGSRNILPLRPNEGGVASMRRRWRPAAIAATAAALGIALSMLLFARLQWKSYTTEVGEQREVALADGSLVHLNTRSRVKVHFSEQVREIELTSGEALFEVARNPARPFRVRAGAAVIHVLGTRFNVYRRDEATTVSVIEGSVRIQDRKVLGSGQKVDIASDGTIVQVAPVDPQHALAWRERRLVFVEERLADIVQEFNRYNRMPRFRLEGEALGDRQLTGVFDTNAPESFIRFLERVNDLSVVRDGERVVIRQADPSGGQI